MTHSTYDTQELLARHNLQPDRSFGQNFVADPNTVRKIARLADVGPGDRVLEIGAGLGALTLALMETGAAVTAVEIDKRIMAVLRMEVEPFGARVVEGDALRMDWATILGPQKWVMVANLPYNIAVPLVMNLLSGVPQIERMLIMVQDEVGRRMIARPGSPFYGAVSVKIRYWALAKRVAKVGPNVFIPRPKVDSALIAIQRWPHLHDIAYPDLAKLVNLLFKSRRQMIRRALSHLTEEDFMSVGLSGTQRAEELRIEDFVRLAKETAALDGRRGDGDGPDPDSVVEPADTDLESSDGDDPGELSGHVEGVSGDVVRAHDEAPPLELS